VELPKQLAVHSPGHLRKPVINRPNEGGGATEHHVVEVRDDPVGTAELVVKDDSTEEHSGDAAENKEQQSAKRKQKRRRELNPSLEQRVDQREHDQVEGQRDADGGRHRQRLDLEVDRREEHMVYPHEERLDGDQTDGDDHPLPADETTAGERLEQLQHGTQRREKNDVHLRVTEKPPKMPPQQGATLSGQKYTLPSTRSGRELVAPSRDANANSIIQTVARMLQVNIGISISPIPSAREWWMVVRKFTDEAVTPQ